MAHVTTSNYDPAGCHDGYLIDAVDYVGYKLFSPAVPTMKVLNAFEHSVAATSKAECNKQRVGVYAWRVSGGSTSYVGGAWVWGEWESVGKTCITSIKPYSAFGIGRTQTTNDYRFAVTARTYTTAGDAGGSYTREAIRSVPLILVIAD